MPPTIQARRKRPTEIKLPNAPTLAPATQSMGTLASCSTFAILAALAAVAPAGAATVIDQRQENQERRIDQGIQSGQLTGPEAERLQRQQNRIETMESKAQADGKVSAAERRKIRRAQNRASRRIWREKHDAQTR